MFTVILATSLTISRGTIHEYLLMQYSDAYIHS